MTVDKGGERRLLALTGKADTGEQVAEMAQEDAFLYGDAVGGGGEVAEEFTRHERSDK